MTPLEIIVLITAPMAMYGCISLVVSLTPKTTSYYVVRQSEDARFEKKASKAFSDLAK